MARGLVDAHEVAARYGVDAQTVRSPRFRKTMGLPAYRVGRVLRFKPEDVEAPLERRSEVFDDQDVGEKDGEPAAV